jgi:CheY-like chemotaxis protein
MTPICTEEETGDGAATRRTLKRPRHEGVLRREPARKPTGRTPARVLLAEDDDAMRDLLRTTFRRAGYEVHACRDGWTLLRRLAAYFLLVRPDDDERFDLIVSDVRMPGLTGLEVLEGSRGLPFPPTILITAFGDAETHAAAASQSMVMFDKPFDLVALLATAKSLAPPGTGV